MSQTATEPLYEVVSLSTGQVVCKPVPRIVAQAIADALPQGGSVRPLQPDPVMAFVGYIGEAEQTVTAILASLDDHLGILPEDVTEEHVQVAREITTRLQQVHAFVRRKEGRV